MNILFLHQNFPGQFGRLAQAMIKRGDQVIALCTHDRPVAAGVRVVRYQTRRKSTPNIHPWLIDTETKMIRAEACLHAMRRLRMEGYMPDLIYAHPGWGEALAAKDVWPQAALLGFFEFYYHARGADVGFDPEFPANPVNAPRLHAKNLVNLMNLEQCDAGVAPTEWQKSLHPLRYHDKIRVIHDGIDTDALAPDPSALLELPGTGLRLRAGEEIITFVSRNLEPYRGYHSFMRALPEILRRRPRARALIVGGDGASYGARPPAGSWKQRFLDEVGADLDPARVHFPGRIAHAGFIRLLQVSAVHVYLSYPFVLSWSMLEAMSAGCLVVASATAPVQEVLRHGENGLLADFFTPADIAGQVIAVLDRPQDYAGLRQRARQSMVEHYDLTRICLPRQLAYIDEVLLLLHQGPVTSGARPCARSTGSDRARAAAGSA